LRLDIIKAYHDLFSSDSRKVKCLGVIKDLVITLAQVPMKSITMDVIEVDIPSKFGMLLSHSWSKKLGGSLHLDMSYATILVFGGEYKRLHRETQLAYIVSDHENSTNI
jgi:hypothetical protein